MLSDPDILNTKIAEDSVSSIKAVPNATAYTTSVSEFNTGSSSFDVEEPKTSQFNAFEPKSPMELHSDPVY